MRASPDRNEASPGHRADAGRRPARMHPMPSSWSRSSLPPSRCLDTCNRQWRRTWVHPWWRQSRWRVPHLRSRKTARSSCRVVRPSHTDRHTTRCNPPRAYPTEDRPQRPISSHVSACPPRMRRAPGLWYGALQARLLKADSWHPQSSGSTPATRSLHPALCPPWPVRFWQNGGRPMPPAPPLQGSPHRRE